MTRRGVGFPIFRALRAAPRALQDAEGFPLRAELPRGPSGKIQRLKLLPLDAAA